MSEIIEEPIEVLASFSATQVIPRRFRWHGRTYTVERVTFVHTTRDGRSKLFHFSVTDGINYFKLCLNAETLTWRLSELDAGPS